MFVRPVQTAARTCVMNRPSKPDTRHDWRTRYEQTVYGLVLVYYCNQCSTHVRATGHDGSELPDDPPDTPCPVRAKS